MPNHNFPASLAASLSPKLVAVAVAISVVVGLVLLLAEDVVVVVVTVVLFAPDVVTATAWLAQANKTYTARRWEGILRLWAAIARRSKQFSVAERNIA